MPAISRDGVSVAYQVSGRGFPLLLSHSFGDAGRIWAPQLQELQRGFEVITWDLRGHGDSDSPEALELYSEAATVQDMVDVLDAADAEHAVLGGLSLGGYLSLAFYLAHPERCRALILCSTGPGYRNPASREQYNADVEKTAAALDAQGLAGLGRSAEASRERGEQRSAAGLAKAARGIQKQRDARVIDSLPEIRVPVLVLVGEKDRAYHAGSDYMASRIPDARKIVIPNAGHTANLHQPEFFNRSVIEFLTEIGVPAAS